MNFTRSCDTRVYRHSSFPFHHQWFSPWEKIIYHTPSFIKTNAGIKLAWEAVCKPVCLLQVVWLKSLRDVRFGAGFLTHHSSLQQERGFARFVPRVAARAWAMPAPGTRLPAAAQGGDSPKLTLSACHTLHPSRIPGWLPSLSRGMPHSGKTRGAHTYQNPPPVTRGSRKTHPMVPGAWRGARHRRGPVNARPSRTLRSGAPAQPRRWLGSRGDAAGNAASRLCHCRPSEKNETKASPPLTSPPAPGEPRRAAATPHRTEGRGAGFAPALCRRRHPGPLRLQTPSAAAAAAAAPASTNGGRRYRFLSPLPSFPVPCFRRARNRLRPAAEARPCPAAETPLPTRRCRPSTATAPGSPRRSLPARGPRLAPPCRDRRQPRGAATDPQRRNGRWARERPLGTRGTVGRAGDRWAREGRLARAEPIDPRGADPCGAGPRGAHRSPRCRSPRSPSIPAVPIDPCGAIARWAGPPAPGGGGRALGGRCLRSRQLGAAVLSAGKGAAGRSLFRSPKVSVVSKLANPTEILGRVSRWPWGSRGPRRLGYALARLILPLFLILPQLQHDKNHNFKSYVQNGINALLGTAGSAVGGEIDLNTVHCLGAPSYSAGEVACTLPSAGNALLPCATTAVYCDRAQACFTSAFICQYLTGTNFSQWKYSIFHKCEHLCKMTLVVLLL